MSLNDLQRLISPPEIPIHAPTADTNQFVQERLGLNLPKELYMFAQTYGSGKFQGDETTCFWINNPGDPGYLSEIEIECQRLRDAKAHSGDEGVPFAIFPEVSGVLPLGLDECNVRMLWRTEGDCDSWPIIVMWERGRYGFAEFRLPLIEFLKNILMRNIEIEGWPEPCFLDNVRFISTSAE